MKNFVLFAILVYNSAILAMEKTLPAHGGAIEIDLDAPNYELANEFCKIPPANVIIVVDDNAVNRLTLSRGLGAKGFRVIKFLTGDSFLSALKGNKIPTLLNATHGIIMDYEMPGLCGPKIAEAIENEQLFTVQHNEVDNLGIPMILNTAREPEFLNPETKAHFTHILKSKNCLAEIEEVLSPRNKNTLRSSHDEDGEIDD